MSGIGMIYESTSDPKSKAGVAKTIAGCVLTHILACSSYALFSIICGGTIHNGELIESVLDDGFILAANHSSYLDWFVLGALFRYRFKRRLTFLVKDRLFHHPLFGPIMLECPKLLCQVL
jgi:hypothetical protein